MQNLNSAFTCAHRSFLSNIAHVHRMAEQPSDRFHMQAGKADFILSDMLL